MEKTLGGGEPFVSLINSYCLYLSKVFSDPLQSLAELTFGNAILKLFL